MDALIQNSSSLSDTLKARKGHLTALLKIVDVRTGKNTTIQTLTISAIKAEINHIDSQLKGRK
ncbi:hypothetical protein POF45_16990 [Pseudomonas sp. 681]|uniref:Uncharacterized protein n=1 Tax=Pseudomonas fungipugnans TaxID=3024217 RepID=A0ABT6QQD7_9PSED|nr:hypothetical protein [Pseudomonas sp. 681]MDI2593111.1 hypothetical protein [Pseudomonas sp. 681]